MRLRKSLAVLFDSLPEEINRAVDLQRVLKLDSNQAWKLFRVVHGTDVVNEAALLPGEAGMKRILQSMKRHVPVEQVQAAEIALSEFDSVVKRHAGDRRTFNSLVAGLNEAENDSPSRNLDYRRAAFRNNSHIWGHQMKARLSCTILRPSHDSRYVDGITLTGIINLCQLRRGRPFVISTRFIGDDDGIARRPKEIERLDVDGSGGINLLREFCSSPMPAIQSRVNTTGDIVTELMNHDVGNGAAFTGFVCDFCCELGERYRDEHNTVAGMISCIESPVECGIQDMLIHKSTFGDIPQSFSAEVWNLIGRGRPEDGPPDILFRDDAVAHLGRGPDLLRTPEYPRYVQVLKHVMDRIGWKAEDFDAYRYRLAYPIMPSAMVLKCDLPEKPSGAV